MVQNKLTKLSAPILHSIEELQDYILEWFRSFSKIKVKPGSFNAGCYITFEVNESF